jgi:UDP-N-acetylglucosamine acyltransferase
MHVIHPTAIVSKECHLEDGVEVGPHCVITGKVHIGRDVRMIGAVHISGPVTIGEGTVLYPHACVGFPGQDFKFKIGDPTAGAVIGKNCILREGTSVHAATKPDRPTTVGDNVLMMVLSHVGHDARVDNRAILVNGAALGGHSHLGEAATMSAYSALHQFGRAGRLSFASSHVALSNDLPPFCLVVERGRMAGLNLIGLRRAGMSREEITLLREAYRVVFRGQMTRDEMLAALETRSRSSPAVAELYQFVLDKKRAICSGHRRRMRFGADVESETVE